MCVVGWGACGSKKTIGQVVRLGNKCLCSLSTLAAPFHYSLKNCVSGFPTHFTCKKIAGKIGNKLITVALTGTLVLSVYLRLQELCLPSSESLTTPGFPLIFLDFNRHLLKTAIVKMVRLWHSLILFV